MKFGKWLEANKEEFFSLARMQRDLPEKAMLKVQHAIGGGVMNSAVEHVGDLSHRGWEKATFPSAGYEFFKPKVTHMIDLLTNGYGFKREFEENIVNNANYLKVDVNAFREKVYQALENYANEHAKLPTYNHAQELAKEAAVSLGRRDFSTTVKCLKELMSHLGSRQEWVAFAHQGLEDA